MASHDLNALLREAERLKATQLKLERLKTRRKEALTTLDGASDDLTHVADRIALLKQELQESEREQHDLETSIATSSEDVTRLNKSIEVQERAVYENPLFRSFLDRKGQPDARDSAQHLSQPSQRMPCPALDEQTLGQRDLAGVGRDDVEASTHTVPLAHAILTPETSASRRSSATPQDVGRSSIVGESDIEPSRSSPIVMHLHIQKDDDDMSKSNAKRERSEESDPDTSSVAVPALSRSRVEADSADLDLRLPPRPPSPLNFKSELFAGRVIGKRRRADIDSGQDVACPLYVFRGDWSVGITHVENALKDLARRETLRLEVTSYRRLARHIECSFRNKEQAALASCHSLRIPDPKQPDREKPLYPYREGARVFHLLGAEQLPDNQVCEAIWRHYNRPKMAAYRRTRNGEPAPGYWLEFEKPQPGRLKAMTLQGEVNGAKCSATAHMVMPATSPCGDCGASHPFEVCSLAIPISSLDGDRLDYG